MYMNCRWKHVSILIIFTVMLSSSNLCAIYGPNIDSHNDQLPIRPASSTYRALHQHHRGNGLSPVQAFLSLLFKTSSIAYLQRSSTLKLFPFAVHVHEISLINNYCHICIHEVSHEHEM